MTYDSLDPCPPPPSMASMTTRVLPRWPPTPDADAPPSIASDSAIGTAIHVISTERAALAHLERLYQTDAQAQADLSRAVDQIARSVREGGKLVVCGVGKSGKIGQKIEATMTSLGIYSAFLHPTEALHGDLGLVRQVSKPPARHRCCSLQRAGGTVANSDRMILCF